MSRASSHRITRSIHARIRKMNRAVRDRHIRITVKVERFVHCYVVCTTQCINHRYLTSAMGCTGAARPNFMCGVVLFQKSDKKVTFELLKEMK